MTKQNRDENIVQGAAIECKSAFIMLLVSILIVFDIVLAFSPESLQTCFSGIVAAFIAGGVLFCAGWRGQLGILFKDTAEYKVVFVILFVTVLVIGSLACIFNKASLRTGITGILTSFIAGGVLFCTGWRTELCHLLKQDRVPGGNLSGDDIERGGEK